MNKKALIIEDDANILYSLQAKFSLVGIEIKANTGNTDIPEIINDLKKFKPEFVILDLILPKVDGFEILKAIKNDEDLLDLPVFIFTSLSDEDSRSRGLELGAKYYFVKSDFNVDEFVDKVLKIVNNKNKQEGK